MLKSLTLEEISAGIIEEYEKKYVTGMNELNALALLLVNAREIKPELTLAVAYAARWVHENKPQGWKVVRNKLRYKRILTLPNQVKVLMIPVWDRFELLMAHLKKYKGGDIK